MPASTGILRPIHRDNLDRRHSIRAFRDRNYLVAEQFSLADLSYIRFWNSYR